MDPCTFLGAVAVFIGGPMALRRWTQRPTPGIAAAADVETTPTAGSAARLAPAEVKPLVSVGPGARIDRWTVEDELGHGGMAVVWQVRDDLGERFALKQLLPHYARVSAVSDRFLSEAALLTRLDHPGLVRALHLVDHAGVVGFVMELLRGQTLARRLDEVGALDPEEVADIGVQILEALAVVHAAGVVHRDLKPANVFLRADGTVTLMDFGIAKLADENRTRTGTVLGTPAYMSPEQVRSPRDVDARSDLFSLGAVLYETLAGVPPFVGASDWEIQQRILDGVFAPLPAEVPIALADVVHRSLRTSPADRPRDAGAFTAAIRSAGIPRGLELSKP